MKTKFMHNPAATTFPQGEAGRTQDFLQHCVLTSVKLPRTGSLAIHVTRYYSNSIQCTRLNSSLQLGYFLNDAA